MIPLCASILSCVVPYKLLHVTVMNLIHNAMQKNLPLSSSRERVSQPCLAFAFLFAANIKIFDHIVFDTGISEAVVHLGY